MKKLLAILTITLIFLSQGAFAGSKELSTLQNLASKGNTYSMILLGDLYASGFDVPQSGIKALSWYAKAAAKGSVIGMMNLGEANYYGRYGVQPNAVKAAKWYLKAAKKGYGPAQSRLANLYFLGQGVKKNYVEAYVWYGLAVASGDQLSKHLKRMVRNLMTPVQVAKGNEETLLYERLYGYANQ